MGCKPSLGKAKILRKNVDLNQNKVFSEKELNYKGVHLISAIQHKTRDQDGRHFHLSTEDFSYASRLSSLKSQNKNKCTDINKPPENEK